jgi:hypothetical protein
MRGIDLPGDKRTLEEKIKYNKREKMIKGKIYISLVIVLLSSLFLGACGVEKSGVEIVSSPIAKVYLNGQESGMTPYKNNSLKPGNIKIKLEDEGNVWEREIRLQNNVTTVINWSLNKDNNSGYILSMEKSGKSGSLLINSSPGGAMIFIDGELKTSSPAKIENVGEGDKKISLNYPGFKNVNLIVKMVKDYQIIIDAKLETEEKTRINVTATPIPLGQGVSMVKIKDTETGWLRVRSSASSSAAEIGRVKPGESYELLSQDNDWYQIKFDNKNGWISLKYAEKI